MRISVVVPTYESCDTLRLCLLSLKHQRLREQDSLEVIVVDDGSTDDTRAMVQDLKIGWELRYFYKPRSCRSGRSGARNSGISKARGDVVVMIDADHVFAPDFIAEHARYHRLRRDLVVVGPRGAVGTEAADVSSFEEGFSWSALPAVVRGPERDARISIMDRTSQNFNNLATCWHLAFTCNTSVRRDFLVQVGGFDEMFRGWGLEDAELAYRLRRLGLAFAFNRNAAVYTWDAAFIGRQKYEEWRTNLTYFVSKHGGVDVAAQWLLDDAFNPDVDGIDWVSTFLGFEYAARAVGGRLPHVGPYRMLQVSNADADPFLSALGGIADAGNVIVIDRTVDGRLAPAVQCRSSRHELLYFDRPDPSLVADILSRYPVVTDGKSE